MNDEDRKFVEAVRQLADITHYMGIPIHEFPDLPAKLREAQERAEKAEAQNAKLKEALDRAVWWFEDNASRLEMEETKFADQKALVNRARARVLRAALAETEGNGQ
jgi:predicted  nucleic acid-binding Zn-ribbon protein